MMIMIVGGFISFVVGTIVGYVFIRIYGQQKYDQGWIDGSKTRIDNINYQLGFRNEEV